MVQIKQKGKELGVSLQYNPKLMHNCLFLQTGSPIIPKDSRQDDRLLIEAARQMEGQLKQNKVVLKIFQEEKRGLKSRILDQISPIKPKMFTKITQWMQKISQQTLKFSSETLEVAIRLLVRYLNIKDIQTKQLQMLGCVCLHLASKINQNTIIAIQSYIECCLGIFTKQQFVQLEEEVYQILDYSLEPTLTLHQLVYLTCMKVLKLELHEAIEEKINKLISEVMKDLEFTQFSRINICCTILAEMGLNQSQQLTKQGLFTLLWSWSRQK